MQFRRLSGAQQAWAQIKDASLATCVNSGNSSTWRSPQYFIYKMGVRRETTSQDIGRTYETIHMEVFIKVPTQQGGGAQRCPAG